jgi:hypothetical protein
MSIILKLFKLAVRVVQYKDWLKLHLPSSCPDEGASDDLATHRGGYSSRSRNSGLLRTETGVGTRSLCSLKRLGRLEC